MLSRSFRAESCTKRNKDCTRHERKGNKIYDTCVYTHTRTHTRAHTRAHTTRWKDTGSSWSNGILKFPFCWKSFLNVGA